MDPDARGSPAPGRFEAAAQGWLALFDEGVAGSKGEPLERRAQRHRQFDRAAAALTEQIPADTPALWFVGGSVAAVAARYVRAVLAAKELLSAELLPAESAAGLSASVRLGRAKRRPGLPKPLLCGHLSPSTIAPLGERALSVWPTAALVVDAAGAEQLPTPSLGAPELVYLEAEAENAQLAEWAGAGLRWFGDRQDAGKPVHWLAGSVPVAGAVQFDLFAGGVACGRFGLGWGGDPGGPAGAVALGLLAETRCCGLDEAGIVLAALSSLGD